MRRLGMAAAIVCLAAVPAAVAATRPLAYQGFTSQGHEIKFKKSRAGVARMKITVRATCAGSQGENGGDYDFTLMATDPAADAVRGGRFTTVLPGKGAVPTAIVKGAFNAHGGARGTITASGRAKGPNGENLGTCKSSRVRWTAAP